MYGEACRQWRVNKGLSQEYMATQLGLRDAKAYQRYEAGESTLTIPMLESIAKVVEAGTVANLLSIGDRLSFNQCNQANTFGPGNAYYESNAKLIDQLHEQIKRQDAEVAFLRKQLETTLKGAALKPAHSSKRKP